MKIVNIILIAIIAVLFVVFPVISLYGDFLWFASLGFGDVFVTVLSAQVLLGLLTGVVVFLVLFFNLLLVRRTLSKKGKREAEGVHKIFILIALLMALIIGSSFAGGWETVLKYTNATPFNVADPLFGNDISFYVFGMPFYYYVLTYVFVLALFSLVFSFLAYFLYSGIIIVKRPKPKEDKDEDKDEDEEEINEETFGFKPKLKRLGMKEKAHLYALAGIIFIIIAVFIYLQQFELLFSTRGVVFGAGYTDMAIYLPLFFIASAVSVITAILFFINIKLDKKLPFLGVLALIGILILGVIAGFIVQAFIVRPNEYNLEKPFIEDNINFTSEGYGINHFDENPFAVSTELSKQDIENNKATINNIRLWDWRPLLTTYNQLQIFRTYYDFEDVDIDRYYINGEYKQVMLSPREINQDNIPEEAQTWVNEHMVYTHGYGFAMSPINVRTAEGLPEFFVKDIPPKSDYFNITQPEIYHGELTNDYIVVKTTTEELDYPKENENVYTAYQGSGGVSLDGFNRLVYAVKFGSIELLFSGSIKSESKILLNRNVAERSNIIAPFLYYESDPYIVIDNGKIYWIIDAYTTTGKYPYSERVWQNINYIRNSVKVVVDAYSGDVTYYVIDNEPIIQTYRKIFPNLFKDFSQMPEGLKKHLRYPEELFLMQAELYGKYHMQDPRVFYNREDLWQIPDEIYISKRQQMEPYYIIMKLPDENKEEFILLIPFKPSGKENLIGWMAARIDGENYGKVLVYSFSKQELIYGVMQFEARVDQDTDISQQITLWSQSGSQVIRGNTLVIPIKDSLIYVEPLYLQATESGSVPELKRVIVGFNNRLTMKETLAEALNTLFGTPIEKPPSGDQTQAQLIQQAQDHYNKALEYLKNGDWANYGKEIDLLGQILSQLK